MLLGGCITTAAAAGRGYCSAPVGVAEPCRQQRRRRQAIRQQPEQLSLGISDRTIQLPCIYLEAAGALQTVCRWNSFGHVCLCPSADCLLSL